uniref:hypothetical protein n=1 Tax=Salmonella sp. s51228 TaxID=3159652 RepID=UPI0039801E7A
LVKAWYWTLTDESMKSIWLINSNDPKTCHKMPYTKLPKVFPIDAKDFTFESSQKYWNGKFYLDTWTSNPPYY